MLIFTAELVIFGVLKFPKVRYRQEYSAIFVPKITGIGQLLLKLSLVVGVLSFFETRCTVYLPFHFHERFEI